MVWAAQIAATTTSGDIGRGIATDSSGNVFVTGSYTAALTLYNQGGTAGTTLPFIGGLECFVAKYSSAGAVVWAARISTTVNDVGFGIATDSSGNVFVTGYYSAALTLYNQGPSGTAGTTLPFTGGTDVFIAKYSSAGDVVWAAQIAGTVDDVGFGIATDSSGNVLVTGYYNAALTIYNQGPSGTAGTTLPYTGAAGGNTRCFLVKYTSAGTVSWAAQIAGTTTSGDTGQAIATDSSGNVFVTGYYSAALTVYNQGPSGTAGTTLPFTGGQDCFIAKYNPDGYITAPVPASSNVLVSATYTPSTFSPNINGFAANTPAGTTLATTGIFVGGPTNYFNGSISELLIYSANLSANQRQQIEGYLTNKWGLSSQIVTKHPYKLIPPATPQPAQYAEVTQGNWTRDWQPYLRSLVAANATGVTVTTSNLTGGATYNAGGGWAGGVLGPDGNIYCTPYVALNILKLTVSTGVTTNITGGATYTSQGWYGGVLGPDGNIYFAPYNALNILCLNVSTGVTTNITGGATYTGTVKWSGGVLGPDGNIYFAPFNATNILKLTVATGVTTNITGGATYTGTVKWTGGVLGPDGNIYFIPYGAANFLRLNVVTGVTTNITGGATYTSLGWFHGALGPDGNIYCAPYNATNILTLNVATGVTSNIAGSATYTTNGWFAGALCPDGNIYFAPHNASNILTLNVATGVTSNITGSATYTGTAKWNGATLAPDGNLYITPYAASNILKLTFSGLSQLPSSNYCMSAYANKW